MNRPSLFALAAAFLALPACSTLDQQPVEQLAVANLARANGAPAGTVELVATGNHLSLVVSATGLPQGMHGFHLHTTGACTAPDFTSAGGHLNPANNSHGTMSPGGSHLGDLPNLEVGGSNVTSTTIDLSDTDRAQILAWLFDADSTAVVIHRGPDDYRTDPAGNAGPRIACGVLNRT
ncbi:superoxide dismutase family protein [Allopontixanthobacter sp.]|uniref:superoxide dismutase family protein n=1 Tax=Allopontixanthobacter sp. TaxID=2906452 RepID=UPI002AB8CDB1|nr:superoxide dismutase family protein [Allopontixanthobacter sp.]MDZ4308369.1 superoxide dismutase family protein [Allopontixanthobacter sp.]